MSPTFAEAPVGEKECPDELSLSGLGTWNT